MFMTYPGRTSQWVSHEHAVWKQEALLLSHKILIFSNSLLAIPFSLLSIPLVGFLFDGGWALSMGKSRANKSENKKEETNSTLKKLERNKWF